MKRTIKKLEIKKLETEEIIFLIRGRYPKPHLAEIAEEQRRSFDKYTRVETAEIKEKIRNWFKALKIRINFARF